MKIDEAAEKWVSEVLPQIHKQLERAGISYSEDLLEHSLEDGFKAGYAARDEEVKRLQKENKD